MLGDWRNLSVRAWALDAAERVSGKVARQTFNSYSWHLLFLIGGGSALGPTLSCPCQLNGGGVRSMRPGGARERTTEACYGDCQKVRL